MKLKPAGIIPKEAITWFKNKALKPGFDYRDVWQQEHAYSFTVAKAQNYDVLSTIRESADAALAEGKTFQQFKKELQPTLEKLGWWGQQKMVDPLTGETKTVQLGSPRRLKTIYSTNMRTARAAGQWERIQRTKRALGFLAYRLGPSEQHRDQHVQWATLVLPVDHPFWATHFPPNGWGCKCWLRQVSKRQADALGGVSANPEIQYKEWTNKRTGEIQQVPAGIDPGWDYNPGMHRGNALDKNLADSEKRFNQVMAQPLSKSPQK